MMKKLFSGIMDLLLLVGILTFALGVRPVRAYGTIRIMADGSIDPLTAPIFTSDNITYTFTDNIYDEIVVERSNITIDGNGCAVQGTGSGNGLLLSSIHNVTIKNMEIKAFGTGIMLASSSNNNIAGKIIGGWTGIWLESSSNNNISGNTILNTMCGMILNGGSNNIICRNDIAGSGVFNIKLEGSSNNNISGNIIGGSGDGIRMSSSSRNNIYRNRIAWNDWGIRTYDSSNNLIYHNNFVNNELQTYAENSRNDWHNGYPSGGNFWSDYNGVDVKSGKYQNEAGSDGIGDKYWRGDHYPLMGPFIMFDAGIWNETLYSIDIVSNSTVSKFQFNIEEKTVRFNVTGSDYTFGFCRVIIPNVIVEDVWESSYIVLVDGQPAAFRNWTDTQNTYIYFTYQHSERQATIIPEFPLTMILPLFVMATLLATLTYRRKRFQ